MTIERGQAAAVGLGAGTALLVAGGLQFSGGYYALAAGIIGAVVVIAATSLLALGLTPSLPAIMTAIALVGLGSWSLLATTWGGVANTSWRFLALMLASAAAVIAGSALGAHIRTLAAGMLAGIAVHAVIVLVTVGSGSAPQDWFQVRQLEASIGYHNGEGAICAMGVPLALWVASSRRPWARAAGAFCVVLFLAVTLLTQSRGSMAAVALAVLVQAVLARRARLVALAACLGLAAVLLFLALQPVDRALVDGRPLDDPAFTHYVTLAFGLAVLLGALSLFSLPPVRLSRRMTLGLLGAGGVLGVVAVGVVAVLLLSRVDDLRQRLTAEPNLASQVAPGDTRLSSFSPTGRIELWRVAIRMAGEKPVAGAGTGSFSRRWSIERTNKDAYVLQPHSLELETLAELGVIGVAFLAAVLGGVFWCARAGVRRDRAIGASVSGALAAFLLIASVDWVYVFVGLMVPVFLLAGALSGTGKPRLPGRLPTVGYVLVMFVALGVLAGPAMAQYKLDQARDQAATSLVRASGTAATARTWDRWDPDVVTFQGLVAEREGRFEDAARLYHRAAELALQPWPNFYREARALQRAGLVEQSRAACRRAAASNPLEPELQKGVCEDVE